MTCARCGNPSHGTLCSSCTLSASRGAVSSRSRRGTPRYQRSSPTSRAGAVSVATKNLTQRDIIVSYVSEHGPVTNREISAALMPGLGPSYDINAVSGRVNEELDPEYGRLRDAGRRRCSVTGHEARVVAARTAGGN